MGFAPEQIARMSLWQFQVIAAAFVASKAGYVGTSEMSDADFEAALTMIEEPST